MVVVAGVEDGAGAIEPPDGAEPVRKALPDEGGLTADGAEAAGRLGDEADSTGPGGFEHEANIASTTTACRVSTAAAYAIASNGGAASAILPFQK